jgi:hypothetical protein
VKIVKNIVDVSLLQSDRLLPVCIWCIPVVCRFSLAFYGRMPVYRFLCIKCLDLISFAEFSTVLVRCLFGGNGIMLLVYNSLGNRAIACFNCGRSSAIANEDSGPRRNALCICMRSFSQ